MSLPEGLPRREPEGPSFVVGFPDNAEFADCPDLEGKLLSEFGSLDAVQLAMYVEDLAVKKGVINPAIHVDLAERVPPQFDGREDMICFQISGDISDEVKEVLEDLGGTIAE